MRGPKAYKDTEIIVFNGIRYRRRPGRKYFETMRYFNGSYRNETLQQAKWRFFRGDIPDGHHIHHKDGNHDNHALSNLECLPRKKHRAIHTKQPAFRKMLSRAARKLWQNRTYQQYVCAYCGETFESRHTDVCAIRYCSHQCGRQARKRARLQS